MAYVPSVFKKEQFSPVAGSILNNDTSASALVVSGLLIFSCRELPCVFTTWSSFPEVVAPNA